MGMRFTSCRVAASYTTIAPSISHTLTSAYLPFAAVARGAADYVGIALVEKEIIEILVEKRAAHRVNAPPRSLTGADRLQPQDPLHQLLDVRVRHCGVGRHWNRAPDA